MHGRVDAQGKATRKIYGVFAQVCGQLSSRTKAVLRGFASADDCEGNFEKWPAAATHKGHGRVREFLEHGWIMRLVETSYQIPFPLGIAGFGVGQFLGTFPISRRRKGRKQGLFELIFNS
jgi:hypothetical protein